MELQDAYLDRVLGEVEDLSSRVLELNGRFARQKFSVKLEHYWELEYVRTRFTEFKRRVEDLENAEDGLTRWRRCWPRSPEWRWFAHK